MKLYNDNKLLKNYNTTKYPWMRYVWLVFSCKRSSCFHVKPSLFGSELNGIRESEFSLSLSEFFVTIQEINVSNDHSFRSSGGICNAIQALFKGLE